MNIGDDEELAHGGEEEDISHEVEDDGEEGQEQDDGQGDLSAEQHSAEENDDAQTGKTGQQERQVRARGENRFQTLTNRTKAAEERAARVERELQELRNNSSNINRQEQERQERERYNLMTPEDQIRYDLKKADERNQATLRQIQLNMHEQNDLNSFNSTIQSNPRLNKYKDEVLNTASGLRQQGNYVPREYILAYLIGKEILAKGPQAGARQQQAGQRRIASQTVKPGSSRSDVSRNRQADERTQRRERLEKMEI